MHKKKFKKNGKKKKQYAKNYIDYRAAQDTFGRLAKPQAKIFATGSVVPIWRWKPAVFFSRTVVTMDNFTQKSGTGISSDKLGPNGGTGYGFSLGWAIGDIPEFASLSGAFDQFIITKVIVRIRAQVPVNTTSIDGTGVLYTCVDYDSTTVPASKTNVLAFSNAQEMTFNQSLLIKIIPAIRIPSVTGNVTSPPVWQDVATATNLHLGLKGFYGNPSASGGTNWIVDAQYWYGFRNKI